MSYKGYYVEGKYRCNHPESDFVNNSNGPIEMKKEDFVEYTHRNETYNVQYDVWSNRNNSTSLNSKYSNNNANSASYSSRTSYNTSKSTKKPGTVVWFILIFWVLPIILSFFSAIIEIIEEAL